MLESKQKCICCSTCLNNETIFFSLNFKEPTNGVTLKEKLHDCLPEIVLESSSDVVVCVSCYRSLSSAYNFRKRCLKNYKKETIEEKLKSVLGKFEISLVRLPREVCKFALSGKSIYACSYCNKLFLRNGEYRLHLSGSKCSLNCDKCNIVFRSKVIFNMHMKVVHGEVKVIESFNLKTTEEVEAPRKKLLSPIKIKFKASTIKEPLKPNKINNCGEVKVIESFNSENTREVEPPRKTLSPIKIKFKASTKKQQLKPKKIINCIFCSKKFSTNSRLARHLSKHQSYCYKCLKCEKYVVNLNAHRLFSGCNSWKYLQPTFSDTKCPFCLKYYPTVADLRAHAKRSHAEFRAACTTCGVRVYNYWEALLHYVGSASGCRSAQVLDRAPPFRCPICKVAVKLFSSLQKHYRNHRKEVTVCGRCEATCLNASEWAKHLELCYGTVDAVVKEETGGGFEEIIVADTEK